jgi:hypothetical protein
MATIEIPAEYADWIRLAAIRELGDEAKGLYKEAGSTFASLEKEAFEVRHGVHEPKSMEWLLSDLTGSARSIRDSLEAVLQVFEGKQEIEGTAEALAYILDTFSRRMVTGELIDSCSPMEGDEGVNELAVFANALIWAGEEVARLRAIEKAEREAKVAQKGGEG